MKDPENWAIIAGGRDFNDFFFLHYKCSKILSRLIKEENVGILSGGARGADKLAIDFAKEKNLPLRVMNADWDKHGKSAGFIRNIEMAKCATHCICFWDGKSRGTKHMIDTAKKMGQKLRVFCYE